MLNPRHDRCTATCGWCGTPDRTYEHITLCRKVGISEEDNQETCDNLKRLLKHLSPKLQPTDTYTVTIEFDVPRGSRDVLDFLAELMDGFSGKNATIEDLH